MPNLFEMGDDVTPIGSYRVASGKVDTPTINHTWDTIKEWLEDVLSFMKGNNNLDEITDSTEARNNLQVFSTAQTQTLITNAVNSVKNSITNDSRLELAFSIQVDGLSAMPSIFLSYYPPKYSGTTLTVVKTGTGKYTLTHNLNLVIHKQCIICNGCVEDSTVGIKSVYIMPNYMKLTFSDDTSANDSNFNLQFFKII